MNDDIEDGEIIVHNGMRYQASNDIEFAKKVILEASAYGIDNGFGQIDYAIEHYGIGIAIHTMAEARDELMKVHLIKPVKKKYRRCD